MNKFNYTQCLNTNIVRKLAINESKLSDFMIQPIGKPVVSSPNGLTYDTSRDQNLSVIYKLKVQMFIPFKYSF